MNFWNSARSRQKSRKGQMFTIDFFIAFMIVLVLLYTYLQFKGQLSYPDQSIDSVERVNWYIDNYFSLSGDSSQIGSGKMDEFTHIEYNMFRKDTGLYEENKQAHIVITTYSPTYSQQATSSPIGNSTINSTNNTINSSTNASAANLTNSSVNIPATNPANSQVNILTSWQQASQIKMWDEPGPGADVLYINRYFFQNNSLVVLKIGVY